MTRSVLDAIRLGVWDFEPIEVPPQQYRPTEALPGSVQKIEILASRLESGLPLWHPEDRVTVLPLAEIDPLGELPEWDG